MADGLWQVTGTHSLPIQRNMVVAQLPSGGLLLHSVVALHEEGMAQLDALGKPEVLVIPHAKHAMDANFYVSRYPNMRIACPPQSHREVGKRYGIDATAPESALRGTGVTAHDVEGAKFQEYALELPSGEGVALVFNDALANDGRETGNFAGRLMQMTGVPGRGFGVSRAMRMFTSDRSAFAEFLRRMSDLPIELLTVSHGDSVHANVSSELRRVADTL